MMLVISLNFPAIFWSHIQPYLPLVVTRPMCDRIATSNNIAQRGHGYLHPTYAAFVDLHTAFDSLIRSLLWLHLTRLQIRDKIV